MVLYHSPADVACNSCGYKSFWRPIEYILGKIIGNSTNPLRYTMSLHHSMQLSKSGKKGLADAEDFIFSFVVFLHGRETLRRIGERRHAKLIDAYSAL